MKFKQVDYNRYQVLSDDGDTLLGSVTKEIFTGYPEGVATEQFFWLAFSKGAVRIRGRYVSRKSAGEAVVDPPTFKHPRVRKREW